MAGAFTKTVLLGKTEYGNVFATIEWDGRRLSICGVEGPKGNGDACGGCGQIVDSCRTCEPAEGMDTRYFAEIWERRHLNDMRAGTPDQELWVRANKDKFPGYPTSFYTWALDGLEKVGLAVDKGYTYGSAWLREAVPVDVIDWLDSLPETDLCPKCWTR